MADIKPRIDADPESPTYGVGWCDKDCPQVKHHSPVWTEPRLVCGITDILMEHGGKYADVCPHHAARNAALLEEAKAKWQRFKDGRLRVEIVSVGCGQIQPWFEDQFVGPAVKGRIEADPAWLKKAGK